MPRLIILNGPPGIGKSTVALRYVEAHPMTLSLEQDVVRGLLGGWRTREAESGALARELCVAMARIHLLAGQDVVVPQFVANPDYLDRLAEVAAQAGAQHSEFVLLDDLSSAERRFHARINDPLRVEHQRTAAAFIEQAGGYAHQYARLVRCLANREPVEVRSIEGDPDGTYRAVLAHLWSQQLATPRPPSPRDCRRRAAVMTEITRLGPTDAAEVEAAAGLFGHAPQPQASRRFLTEPGHHLLIAYDDDGAPIGMVTGVEMTHPDKGTEMFLYELGVHESHRGRGVGRALVAALADVAKTRHCYGMWVLTDDDNRAAVKAYLAAGAKLEDSTRLLAWTFTTGHDPEPAVE